MLVEMRWAGSAELKEREEEKERATLEIRSDQRSAPGSRTRGGDRDIRVDQCDSTLVHIRIAALKIRQYRRMFCWIDTMALIERDLELSIF